MHVVHMPACIYMCVCVPLPLSHQSPSRSLPRVLSQELADLDQSSSRGNTPLTRRELFPGGQGEVEGEGVGERREAKEGFSMDPSSEGFESQSFSLVTKDTSDAQLASLHVELMQQKSSPKQSRHGKSHDTHVTSSDSHVTKTEPTDTALSHLTNDILTYSNQVAMTTTDNTAAVSQSTWLPSREDVLRPTSPMAVNRVFKVVFLGKKPHHAADFCFFSLSPSLPPSLPLSLPLSLPPSR